MTESSSQGEDENKPLAKQLSTRARITTSLLAGAIAGGVAKSSIAPLDRAKINYQVSSEKKYSTKAAIKFLIKSYKTEGFISLWRGNSATMVRILPYSAIQFSSHEQFKRILGNDTNIKRFLAGSMAGAFAQTLTYPLDITRARLAVANKAKYSNLVDVFIKIIRDEGVAGLYKGYVPTILGVVPYAGFSFYGYDTCKKLHAEKYGPDSPISPLARLSFGACAGVLGQTSSYPLDIVRRRMQVAHLNGEKYGSVISSIKRIYIKEGIVGGLYKGISMNWLKGPIAVGMSFTVFDILQIFFRKILTEE